MRKFLTTIQPYLPMPALAAVLLAESTVWEDAIDFIMPWLFKGGAAVAVVGIIMFALGVKDNEPDRKVQGLMTVLAGGLIAATGAFAPNFLK